MVKAEQILYRVVEPNANRELLRLPSFTFRPHRPQDNGLLSVYNAEAITPQECLDLYNRDPNRSPATRVAQITAGAFREVGLEIIPDPETHPAHLLVDYRNTGNNQARKISRRLCVEAERLGIIQPYQAI